MLRGTNNVFATIRNFTIAMKVLWAVAWEFPQVIAGFIYATALVAARHAEKHTTLACEPTQQVIVVSYLTQSYVFGFYLFVPSYDPQVVKEAYRYRKLSRMLGPFYLPFKKFFHLPELKNFYL